MFVREADLSVFALFVSKLGLSISSQLLPSIKWLRRRHVPVQSQVSMTIAELSFLLSSSPI